MTGYGKILSIYSGQQPAFTEMLTRFNLSFVENASIKWLHAGDVFTDTTSTAWTKDGVESTAAAAVTAEEDDPEQ